MTPRIRVLDCSIYHLYDSIQGRRSLLVEERLDHLKWTKWNSNVGTSNKRAAQISQIVCLAVHVLRCPQIVDLPGFLIRCEHNPQAGRRLCGSELSPIGEDTEDNSDSQGDDDGGDNLTICNGDLTRDTEIKETKGEEAFDGKDTASPHVLLFDAFDVAQALSHLSHFATGRKRLICDIRGMFDGKSKAHDIRPRHSFLQSSKGRSQAGAWEVWLGIEWSQLILQQPSMLCAVPSRHSRDEAQTKMHPSKYVGTKNKRRQT